MNRRPLFFLVLLVTCWLPLLTMAVAVCIEALAITGKPTVYVARGKVIVAVQPLRVPGSAGAATEASEFLNTQIEIIQSGELKRRALERVRGLHPELKEVAVEIHATRNKGTSLFTISASGAAQKFTRVYLDALLDDYMAFRSEIREKLHQEGEDVAIMERPMAAVPDAPDLVGPIVIAAVLGGGAGLAVSLIIAGLIAYFAGKPKPPKIMAV